MESGPCCVCGKEGEAACSRCRAAVYCGPDCQRQHWPQHRTICRTVPAPQGTSAQAVQALRAKPGGAGKAEAGGAGRAADARPNFGPSSGAAAASTSIPRSMSGTPGPPAGHDVVLSGQRSLENAKRVVDILMKRGVCVVKAGADKSFQKALNIESKLLWDTGMFTQAMKGQPVVPGSSDVKYDARDDKVIWMSSDWTEKNEKRCKALKVLDGQLGDFGKGLQQVLEDQLGLALGARTVGMLSCYDGDSVPGARYDYHVDNPYQTAMETKDDKRRLTLVYYVTDGGWDVHKDGGGLQLCLSDPRKAPRTTAEALTHEKMTVAPECDTMAVFFSHTMYHAVLPVVGKRRRFALSTWFQAP